MSTNCISSLPYPAFGINVPIGNADFESLRISGGIYVDKTDMFCELTGFNYVFLSRPRRFGKTLLVSTLETLFRDGLKNFQGVRRLYKDGEYVEEPFKITKLWQRPVYPVVRLDFSFMKEAYGTREDFFREEIAAAFEKAGFHLDGNSTRPWTTQLKNWLLSLPPFSIVLLVDEYDAGLGCRLNDNLGFSQALSLLSSFFDIVKATTKVWSFVFITGIARFGKASIFSSMNELVDISFKAQFGTLLGYTEEELRENFAPYLEKAAVANNTDIDGLLDMMRRFYDGFCFDDDASTHVYAPWSVLHFLADSRHKFRNYWVESSGSPSALIQYIKSGKDKLKVLASDLSIPLGDLVSITSMSDLKLELLLNQTGYLTILDIDDNDATLGFPNQEVSATYSKLCLSALLQDKTTKECRIPSVSKTLGTGNPDAWASLLNKYFSSIAYDNYPVSDEAMCRLVTQTLVAGSLIDCRAEVHGAFGRSDLEIFVDGFHWILELKYVRDGGMDGKQADIAYDAALKSAVKQMRDRKYGEWPVGYAKVRMALVFSETERQFVRWESIS